MRNQHPTGTPKSVYAWAKKQPKPPKGTEGWFELRRPGMSEALVVSRWPAAAARGTTWGESVISEAQADAENFGQLTEYHLVWMHGGQDVATRTIRQGNNSGGGGLGNVNSPEDMVNASMKMVHDMHRMMLESNAAIMQKQEAMTNALFKRVQELEKERSETMDLYIEAMKMIAAVEQTEDAEAQGNGEPNQAVMQLARLALAAVGSQDPEKAKKLEAGLKLVEGSMKGAQ